jgi:hydroxymethylpyrimidine pyrophosphatase-like HAD family hydrolase
MIILLTDDHIISEENKEMLLKRRKKEPCYLASGRPTPAMIAYAKELKLDNSYMISYNGAVITDLKEENFLNKC